VPKENIRDAVSELSAPAEPSKTPAPVRAHAPDLMLKSKTEVFTSTLLGESSLTF